MTPDSVKLDVEYPFYGNGEISNAIELQANTWGGCYADNQLSNNHLSNRRATGLSDPQPPGVMLLAFLLKRGDIMRKSPKKKPSLRFFYSEELHANTLKLLDALEQAEDPTQYRDALGDLVVELTDGGMDYYFLKPLQLAEVGFVVQQSANLGMAGALRIIGSVIRNIISYMDKTQLLTICGYIRQLMR